MIAYGLTLQDVIAALTRNNKNQGAGYIERNGQQLLVRVPGQVSAFKELEQIVLDRRDGVPIRLRDVAVVIEGHDLRSGAATENGREVVLGTVFMLVGQNSRQVARAVADRIVAIQRSLPDGIVIEPVYDRTTLVEQAEHWNEIWNQVDWAQRVRDDGCYKYLRVPRGIAVPRGEVQRHRFTFERTRAASQIVEPLH